MAELYNPTMVEITVSNSETRPDVKEKFTIPRGLICQSSKYFEKLFKGSFVEGQKGSVELSDVEPWVFRCFTGWLYSGRVFVEPSEALDAKSSAMSGTEEVCSKSDAAATTNDTDHSAVRSTEVAQNSEQEAEDGSKSSTGAPASVSVFGSSQMKENTTEARDDVPTFSQTRLSLRSKGPEHLADEDLDDPATWHWYHLFSLYIFSDKYDVPELRSDMLDIIQMKMFARHLHGTKIMKAGSIEFAVINLPPSSPLSRFLADICGVALVFTRVPDPVKGLLRLPSDFIAACFLSSKRHIQALKCQTCREGVPHDYQDGHASVDGLQLNDRNPCFYHEHEKDGEQAKRCASRWKTWFTKLREAEKRASEKSTGQP